MPEFLYQAKQGPEKLIEGVIEAPTESDAIEKISQQGYVPVHIALREKVPTAAAPAKIGRRPRGKLNLYLFSAHLARMIKSGVPILKGMVLLAGQEKDRGLRAVLSAVEREMREGKSLSGALQLHPNVFSPMYVAVVRAGEMGGGLQEALLQMAAYYKKQQELGSKVRRALAYPIVLLAAGVLSIFFVLTFLVPRLQKMFTEMGRDLPFPTRVVLQLGSFMHHYWIGVILVTAALFLFMPRLIKDRFGKNALDTLKLKTPVLGDLVRKIEFSRFCRMFALCLNNGISFHQSLREVIPAVDNAVIRGKLEECSQSVEKGSSFGQSLKKHAFFSELAVNLITLGEESGRVDETLTEIAELYEQEADETLLYLTTFLEPAMILVVGGIIGFIVMAVLLPIFEMNSSF